MFNIGLFEMVVIAVLALLVIGPKQLPEVARSIGKFLNELKRNTGDISSAFFDANQTVQKAKTELKKRAGLDEITKNLNQSRDEFIENLKKEIDSLPPLEKETAQEASPKASASEPTRNAPIEGTVARNRVTPNPNPGPSSKVGGESDT